MSDAPVFVGGHSLGAARALLYAWSRLKRGKRVDGIYALAPPRPGDNYIGLNLAASPGVIVQSLKNRRDFVTNVPVDMKLINERYEPAWPFTEVDEPGGPGLFGDHHIDLYQAGARKLPGIDASIQIAAAADQIARLYDDRSEWDWLHDVDGEFCSMKIMPSGARLVIFRGSITALDWLDDFDARQILIMGARVSEGFWRGVAAVQDLMDAQIA